MAKILAFCNQKGGTGKTTSAINVGAYLALGNRRVLIVDIDPQGNATSGLGIDRKQITHSLYDLLSAETPQNTDFLPSQLPNLFIVPSHINLTGLEVELVTLSKREYRLRETFDSIKANFDFILIDCPPSLGLLTINALCAADSVLIPVQCEYYALEGLTQLLNTIKMIKENLNTKLELEGLILTMADYRTNLTQEVIEEIRQHFKDKVYQTIIPRNIKLSESPGFGKPIALYDKDSIGAQRYQELTQEILGRRANLSALDTVNTQNTGE